MQFNGPVLELMTAARVRSDPRLAGLGPDLVAAAPFDEARFLRRLREDDPTRTLGRRAARPAHRRRHRQLLEVGGLLAGAASTRGGGSADVTDEEALAVVRGIRPLMQQSAGNGRQSAFRDDLRQGGAPCPRCGAPAPHPGARPGRRQPHHLLVPRCQR